MDVPAVAVVRAKHPLCNKKRVRVSDLSGLDWMLPIAGTQPRITYDNFFLAQGAEPPNPLLEIQPLSVAIRPLLLKRDIATIIPLVLAEEDAAEGRIKILPIKDKITFKVYLIRREMSHHSPACEYVISEFRTLCAKLSRPI